MIEMLKRWTRVGRLRDMLRDRQKGQSLIIIVFAFIGILALVGLGIDLGLVYVERVRVVRAADAVALSAVSELPLEEAAHARAMVYLQENGYDPDDVAHVRLVVNPIPTEEGGGAESVSGPSEKDAQTVIWLDTRFSRDPGLMYPLNVDTSDRIRVRIRRQVPMTFMQFVGFRSLPVEGVAEAENISSLDIVIVYDESGSMEFDTLCYGCWEPPDEDHPDGIINPLRWSQDSPTATPDHCKTGNTYADYGNFAHKDEYYRYKYGDRDYWIVIEAEEYSSYESLADYHLWGHTPYKTFWVIQRNDKGSKGRDSQGGYLSHHPYANYSGTSGYGVRCTWDALTDPNGPYCRLGVPGGPFPAPRADYEFTAPVEGEYYFWLRGQGGGTTTGDDDIYWGVDSDAPQGAELNFRDGVYYDGASDTRWDWERMGLGSDGGGGDAIWLSAGEHTLSLWAGGAGFDVDRIIITTDDTRYDEDGDDDDYNGSDPNLPLKNAGPNNARTDWACERCDPRFAGWDPVRLGLPQSELLQDNGYWLPHCDAIANPDLRDDPIFEGEQPIRSALDAATNFISRMDFRLDQVGYVSYESSSGIRNELECLRRRGPENLDDAACDPDWSDPGDEPPRDTDCGCFSGVITNTVLYELNHTTAGGSTNIAGGIEDGIDVLSTRAGHFGRPGAAHIMVLMTDGEANRYPSGSGTSSSDTCSCSGSDCCCTEDLWPDGGAAKDCVVYYARQARDNGIVVYTISLGYSADLELMQEVANTTGGFHRWAPTPDKLDAIFDELFKRIFLRLVH